MLFGLRSLEKQPAALCTDSVPAVRLLLSLQSMPVGRAWDMGHQEAEGLAARFGRRRVGGREERETSVGLAEKTRRARRSAVFAASFYDRKIRSRACSRRLSRSRHRLLGFASDAFVSNPAPRASLTPRFPFATLKDEKFNQSINPKVLLRRHLNLERSRRTYRRDLPPSPRRAPLTRRTLPHPPTSSRLPRSKRS